ncbi:MAG: hypothetical protein JSR62_10105 [Nitrospira sp.]|nr:hypothetical protein [Nitrospira sp.]
MRQHALGILVLTGLMMAGRPAGAVDVPAPVPQPGPGPTVPPKPSDPIPLPPTIPPPIRHHDDVRSGFVALAADRPEPSSETVSGLLEDMNLEQRTGRLTTDMGKTVSFSIPNPALFRHLSIGERLTVKLDSKQQAIGVLEQPPPELLPPPHDAFTPSR